MTELTIVRANPAGNVTLLVSGEVETDKYSQLGAKLLSESDFAAEQVGFIREPIMGGAGRLEMAGGEFCGNASRAFATLLAKKNGIKKGTINIEISGCDALVPVEVDLEREEAFANMPKPEKVSKISLPEPYGELPIVYFQGIWHIIAYGFSESPKAFDDIKEAVYQSHCPEALGVMFLTSNLQEMVPVVYVHGPKSLYVENSCGSGTTAVAAWLASKDESFTDLTLKQPGGSLSVHIERVDGIIRNFFMGGLITMDSPVKYHI